MARLGVNIDHIATLRQLRGTPYPDLLQAARAVERAGGHQITVHLREDRRHIQDSDVKWLRSELKIPLNLEMSVADEIVRFGCRVAPDWACLVPEKRQEQTTEGGLDLKKSKKKIAQAIDRLIRAKIKVSLFIEPSLQAVKLSQDLGAQAVELHTGTYAHAFLAAQGDVKNAKVIRELKRIEKASALAQKLGIGSHAGHGLDRFSVRPLAFMKGFANKPAIEEFNIGHALVCRATEIGLESAVREMASAMESP